MKRRVASALQALGFILVGVWPCGTTGITTDDDLAADPFTADAANLTPPITNRKPGGYVRPGDLPFDDPALTKHVL